MPLAMPLTCRKIIGTLVLGSALAASWTAWGGEGSRRDAARQVSAGIARHRQGDFAAAEQAFSAAAQALPADPRIEFDQACALAELGKQSEAEALFERTKLARDPKISAGSLYNLGCLAARQAQEKFGVHPEQADASAREAGMQLLDQAIARYRDCLAVDPDHADGRHNLELLRVWIKHMREVWKERDRQQRRNELDLLAFLELIEREQSGLRGATRELLRASDSPRRRQAASLLGQSQRELAEEIPFLQQKLREALTASPPSDPNQPSPGPPPLDPQREQALSALTQLAQQAHSAMSRAAADLASNQLASAESSQSQALPPLDEIYRAVAPFEHLLQKAIRVEEGLIPKTRSAEELAAGVPEREDLAKDLPAEQQRVAGWAGLLSPKAQQAAETLKSQPIAAGPAPPPPASQPPVAPAAPGAPTSSEPLDPIAQREALQAAYAQAIELAPQAQESALAATAALDRQAWAEAIPHEETTLRILREIAEQLPRQTNQDSPQDQPQQPEQGQDQKQQDGSSDSRTPESGDEQTGSKDQKPQQSPQKSGQESNEERERRQAESLLRMVRERERDYHDQLKKRQAVIGGVKVDKDW